MGDFPGNERHQNGTRAPIEALNVLKTNGAVVAGLADAHQLEGLVRLGMWEYVDQWHQHGTKIYQPVTTPFSPRSTWNWFNVVIVAGRAMSEMRTTGSGLQRRTRRTPQ